MLEETMKLYSRMRKCKTHCSVLDMNMADIVDIQRSTNSIVGPGHGNGRGRLITDDKKQ